MRQRCMRRRSAGFTLVELMVGMVLSLFIAAALGTLVVNMSRAHAELDRSSQQIENGRYAIDLLSDEIKLAGFYADATTDPLYTQPAACATAIANLGWSTSPIRAPNPIEGFTGDGDVPPCVTANSSHVFQTGLLALHRLSVKQTAVNSVSGVDAYVQSSQCTSVPLSIVISANPADFTLENVKCDAVNPVRRYLSRIYYVSPCSDCAPGDGIPTLKRLDLEGGAWKETALAEGIQEMQFEYGFDTSATPDGAPDEFRTTLDGVGGSKANDWANVMAVRVWVLSRTTEATRGYSDTKTYNLGAHGSRGPFNDGFKRRVYTTVVRLQNPAGWRES
ncbi:MAG TPA: PilW family protein [Steroidobacter sp.]|nr:PilW family protein [Steroidobacter sp.]